MRYLQRMYGSLSNTQFSRQFVLRYNYGVFVKKKKKTVHPSQGKPFHKQIKI